MLKVGGRVVLLVGAEFRQLLLDCVGRLNDDAGVQATECDGLSDTDPLVRDVQTDHVLRGSDADGASNTGVDSSREADGTTVSRPVTVEYEQSVGEAASLDIAESRPVWTAFLEHYVKLGETHAYICGFIKNR